jgi:hypothetical protein
MATLHVIWDPDSRLVPLDIGAAKQLRIRQASLDCDPDLEAQDIYELARRVAALLLEQAP